MKFLSNSKKRNKINKICLIVLIIIIYLQLIEIYSHIALKCLLYGGLFVYISILILTLCETPKFKQIFKDEEKITSIFNIIFTLIGILLFLLSFLI